MPRLVTEWSTDDPTVAELLKELNAIPEYSPERLEAEAGLHALQAKWGFERAAVLRHSSAVDERKAAKARATREARKQVKP